MAIKFDKILGKVRESDSVDISGKVDVAGDTMTGQLFIDGSIDEIQSIIQGHSTQTSNLSEWQNSSGSILAAIDESGRLGVGTDANPDYGINVSFTETDTSGEKRGLSFFVLSNPTEASSTSVLGLSFAEHQADQALTGAMCAFFGSRNSNVNTVSVAYGGFSEVQQTAAGVVSFGVGQVGSVNDTGGGNITTSYALQASANIGSGGTITTHYGLQVDNPTGAGSVTTNYGIHVSDQTKGGTNRGIVFDGGGLNNSIQWAGDTNLYRAYANGLATDDDFVINGDNIDLWIGNFDLQVYHDATNTHINNYTGELQIDASSGNGVKLSGSLGFYGTTPIAQQTGVAVSAAGIHAALVNLGLITA